MNFLLEIETDSSKRVVYLKLHDSERNVLSNTQVKIDDLSPALQQGLFDTRAYVERYSHPSLTHVGAKSPEILLSDLGVSLGLEIIGKETMDILSGGEHRSLHIKLPDIKDADSFAAAFARVPWEIARVSSTDKPLFEQDIVFRMTLSGIKPGVRTDLEYNPLRILLVFVEAIGSPLLSMRLEREQLLNLFNYTILPQKNVEVDILCYGVSRQRLETHVRGNGGYNIIHWSGHGNYNCLELQDSNGNADRLSGQDFVELIRKTGAQIPKLVFLSSCLSGAFVKIRNWQDFHDAMSGTRAAQLLIKSRESSDPIQIQPGYTGVASELIRAGIPQVIAMRYEIGDDYARELSNRFYRHLLGETDDCSAENAFSLARRDLALASSNARLGRRECQLDEIAENFYPVDLVTPVFFGDTEQVFRIKSGESQQLQYRDPRPQPLLPSNSKDLEVPESFVGRGKELTLIANRWLLEGRTSLILIQGLGGMGKTTLTAEIIHLWHTFFNYIFVFQSKEKPLELEEFLRRLDLKLRANSLNYRERLKRSPTLAIYLPIGESFNGSKRYDQLFSNIVEVLHEEKILLIFDNFETNLEIESPQQHYKCKDPIWDLLFQKLSGDLPETGSRLIITSRRMLTSLVSDKNVLWVLLGPLSLDEVYLFIQNNDTLKKLYASGFIGQKLLNRLIMISRGHPLILNYLSKLANDPPRLEEIITRMESKEGWQILPDLFTDHLSEADRDLEREYLEQATCTSIDLIIQGLSLHGRRLLWIITRSNEPVDKDLIKNIWMNPLGTTNAIDRREVSNGSSTGASEKDVPVIGPLLLELQHAGVLHQESEGVFSYQEVVQDRISKWMSKHSNECSDLLEQQIWHDFAIRYEALYITLVKSGLTGAMNTADEIALSAIKYYILCRDFESVGECLSRAVVTIANPIIINDLIQEILPIKNQIPAGSARWRIFGSLGGLLAKIGDQESANELFILALRDAEEAGNWVDIGILSQNWATTFAERGDFTNARKVFSRGRDYQIKSALPPIYIVMSEIECLRIDVYMGKAIESWPKIEKRLERLRNWWKQHRSGQHVTEAPDSIIIGRGLVSGFDIALLVKNEEKLYDECLALNDEMIQVLWDLGESELQLARSHLNRCQILIELNRLDEAQPMIEYCLDIFRECEAFDFQVQALNALAAVWKKRKDYPQAISVFQQGLAICNGLPNPIHRAVFHSNLAMTYRDIDCPEENARHMLASIIYNLISAHIQDLKTDLQHRGVDVTHFNLLQKSCYLPRVTELIALPEFYPLAKYLMQNKVNLEELQLGIDQLEEDVRRDV